MNACACSLPDGRRWHLPDCPQGLPADVRNAAQRLLKIEMEQLELAVREIGKRWHRASALERVMKQIGRLRIETRWYSDDVPAARLPVTEAARARDAAAADRLRAAAAELVLSEPKPL